MAVSLKDTRYFLVYGIKGHADKELSWVNPHYGFMSLERAEKRLSQVMPAHPSAHAEYAIVEFSGIALFQAIARLAEQRE